MAGRDKSDSELKSPQQQYNLHRNKVCKFQLYYSRKFQVLQLTKISHTFLRKTQPSLLNDTYHTMYAYH